MSHLSLFEAVGIEIEYMIVDAAGLGVLPVADRVLESLGGTLANEVELGDIAASNELAMHVIELKTNGPVRSLVGVGERFQEVLGRVEGALSGLGGRLLPTGMHPWMDPERELSLWSHGDSTIYSAFDRIFGCRGHGWANLQSMHINLPFADDEQLGQLHSAIRFVLPILPALAASSPLMEGAVSGRLDSRLAVYRQNCARIPQISGEVVPEPIATRADYERDILQPIYRALAPLDPEGILAHEWVNARGAIARFDRYAVEIRVLDTQESVRADLAVAAAVIFAVRSVVESTWRPLAELSAFPGERLVTLYERCVTAGDAAEIDDSAYLAAWGFTAERASASELWQHISRGASPARDEAWWTLYAEKGCLARRVLADLGARTAGREAQRETYGRLADCLREGSLFLPRG